MKQHYTLTLTLSILLSLGAQAQITIGQPEMPYANDVLERVRAVNNPQINYTATGPAHTWNFPNLAANTGDTTNYQTVASTSFVYAIVYADLGFNANRANHAKPGTDIPFSGLLPINNPYTFRYLSFCVYKTVCYGVELSGIPLPIIFTAHDVIYELPLNYGDASASHSSYNINIPNVGYYGFEQDRMNEVDGWGAITTPGGVFDVLRVKTTLTMHDSLFGFTINRPVVHEYKWLTPGLRVPVLQINTTTIFGNEVVTAIYYYDVPRTIEVVDPLATTICPGATLDVHYEVTGAFNAGGFFVPANHFTAQLSDASGSFADPVDIGDVTATASGTIAATIPANTPVGSGYRIRVISTSPDYVGTSNPFNITIGGTTVAAITAGGPTLICTNETLLLTAVGGPGYQWQLDGNDITGANDATYEANAAGTYNVVVDNTCGTATSNSIVVELNTPPVQTVDGTSYLICAGASVEISAHDQSGQLPLSYQWYLNNAPIVGATDTVVTATLGGIYTAQVTNGTTGCSFTTEDVQVDVDAISTPLVSADGNTTFCEGGTVSLSATDLPPNTYQWYMDGIAITGATSNTLDVDAAGDYTVVTTNANGCASEASAIVTITVEPVPTAPNVMVDGATTFCEGGSVTLSIPNIAGTTYQWYMDGSVIDLATDTALVVTANGDYTVVVTNTAGCASAASATTSVTVNALPTVPGVTPTEPTTFCAGGGVSLIADLIGGVSYQWLLDGVDLTGMNAIVITVNTAGAYTVMVTNAAGCTATSIAVDVVVNPLPSQPVITGSNDSLLVSGNGTFQWYLDGVAIPGGTDPWWIPTENGNYTVQYADANGCSSLSEAWLHLTTGIPTFARGEMRVLPNPSNGSFAIEVPDAHGQAYEILDATGKIVRTGRLSGIRTGVDMNSAQQGMYFLRVQENGSVLRFAITR